LFASSYFFSNFLDSDHIYQVPRDQDDPLNLEPTRKLKIPHEWKRLQITNDYFLNRPLIKTSSIRETLSIDSGVCSPSLSDSSSGHKHVREISGGFIDIDMDSTDSKKSSPDVDRKSLENSDDYESSKKKGWFTKRRNKKKMKQMSEDENSANTLPAISARQNLEKMKRYSVDALSFLDNTENRSQQPNGAEQNGRKGPRKSEGDINFNSKHLVNQQTERSNNLLHPDYSNKTENGIQMSLC